jgi:hypothetical protein
MPFVGFDPMIPVFEQAKTVRDSDRAVSVIGSYANSSKVSSVALVFIYSPYFFNATSITFTLTSYIYLQTFPVFVKKESASYS